MAEILGLPKLVYFCCLVCILGFTLLVCIAKAKGWKD